MGRGAFGCRQVSGAQGTTWSPPRTGCSCLTKALAAAAWRFPGRQARGSPASATARFPVGIAMATMRARASSYVRSHVGNGEIPQRDGMVPSSAPGWATTNLPPGPKLAPWQVRLAQEAMGARISGSIMITDIAGECRLSMSYFVRAFRNTVGVAPYDWFLGQKVLRAQELLVRSDASLAEIALECGFTDQSHFTNTFVRRVGQTPLQWRRSGGGM